MENVVFLFGSFVAFIHTILSYADAIPCADCCLFLSLGNSEVIWEYAVCGTFERWSKNSEGE